MLLQTDQGLVLPGFGPKFLVGGAVLAVAAILVFVSLPGQEGRQTARDLPWQIQTQSDGSSRVFGITLGTTTLREAENRFRVHGELTLFVSPSGALAVEAFFENVALSGIRAKFVLSIDLGAAVLHGMMERGLRVSTLPGGTRKVTLHPDDRALVRDSPVTAITYIPAADLDEDLIRQRFGEPMRRIAEDEAVSHWLYPHFGLDIAVRGDGKEVLQYVPPEEFARLLDPLLRRAEDNR